MAAAQFQQGVYGTFFGVGYGAIQVLEAGVDYTRLRKYLPLKSSGSDSGLSLSLGGTPFELNDFARLTGDRSRSSSVPIAPGSTPAPPSPGSDKFRRESRNSSANSSPSSLASDVDAFISECETQYGKLFRFIQRNIDAIEQQLETNCDCVIVPTDHYASMTQSVSSTAPVRPELTKAELVDSVPFCDNLLEHVTELKNCLMMNLRELHGILESHNKAFPDEKDTIGQFRMSKRQSINEVTGQLEHCRGHVLDHKHYLEARLRVVSWKDLMKPEHKQFTFFSLAHFIIFLLSIAALAWFGGDNNRYIGLFYLYRGPMFVILFLYLYAINLVGWATAKIRYIDIFNFTSAQETPTPYIIFNIAGVLSLTFAIFVSALLFTVHYEDSETPERILPIALWIITAVFLLNPFKWFIRKGRWGVVKVALRILFAPFYRVRFGDFWFADQLNSIVVILLDFEFMICFFTYLWPNDENEDGKVCNGNRYAVRPFISCLPALWRLLQCLRVYYDTKHYPHLINAGKYCTTFPVVVLFALFTLDNRTLSEDLEFHSKEGYLFTAWLLSSIIHAVYTFVWDVYMDWGLFHSKDLLRPTIIYRWKVLYYLAIVEDLLLRFAWSLKLSLGLQLRANVNLIYTALATLEILRRFVWNFFRVEYEHVKITATLPSNDVEKCPNEKCINKDSEPLLAPFLNRVPQTT